MAKKGRFLMSSVSSKISESRPKWFWLFFLCLWRGGKQKSIKKIGKNNRDWGKFRHFVGVEKNREEGKKNEL